MRSALLLVALAWWPGCGSPLHLWGRPPVVFRASGKDVRPRRPAHPRGRAVAGARPSPPERPHGGPAGLVEHALHERGITFGTDGSLGSLYEYLRDHHRPVAPSQALAGDVLFFDMADGCPGHVGLVESVDPDGRLIFRERRGAELLRSYADPGQPTARRDGHGRVRNTFLRPRLPDDPPSYRYYAGEMLCAVIRIERPRR